MIEHEATVHVYYLADPRAPRHPRYVGMTKDLVERQRKHATVRGFSYGMLGPWQQELREAGVAPVLVTLAAYPTRELARAAEWRLIRRWRRRGLCDYNTARDGQNDAWVAMCHAKNARRRTA